MAAQCLVEQLLARTSSLHFASERRPGQGGAEEAAGGGRVSFVHAAVLEHLLASPQLRPVLEALLDGYSSGAVRGAEGGIVEAFLQARCGESGPAGEMLWKHRLRQGRPREAAEVLLRLAERKDSSCSLAERVRILDQSRQAASRALPGSKDLVERVTAQLDVAARVQLPLLRELQLLANDGRVSTRWHEVAEQRRLKLEEKLLSLQDLYHLAVDFGLYHLVLIIADLSSSIQEQEIGSSTWVSMLLPPQGTPYSQSELQAALPVRQLSMFPLLMVRRSAAFLLQGNQPQLLPEASTARQEDLKLRVVRLISELNEALKPGSQLWDHRCVATLLEYCNCLWHKSVGSEEVAAGRALASPQAPLGRPVLAGAAEAASSQRGDADALRPGLAWVALEVLTKKPFHLPLSGVVKFYAAMISHTSSWAKDP